MEFKEIIAAGCREWGIELAAGAEERMERFFALLTEANRRFNLTAITEPEEAARRHMLDCLFLLRCEDMTGKRIIDIGCGAGFPSLPLLCARPELDITALDSTKKRVDFVAESCDALGLRINAVCARAEEHIDRGGLRGGLDIAVSRAEAALPVLCELCLPYLRVGGALLAMKSDNPQAEEEILSAAGALRVLGGEPERREKYELDGAARQVLVIRKVRECDRKYPRRYAKILSAPLK